MLEPKEASDAYRELSQIATGEGLQWLLEDVERQIALGKQATKHIQVESTVRGPDADYLPKKKGRPARFIVTGPYSEREKLLLLIEALEAASVGLSRGLLNTYEIIRQDLQDLDALGFAPDTEGSDIMYVKSDFLRKKPDVMRLGELLQELREAV